MQIVLVRFILIGWPASRGIPCLGRKKLLMLSSAWLAVPPMPCTCLGRVCVDVHFFLLLDGESLGWNGVGWSVIYVLIDENMDMYESSVVGPCLGPLCVRAVRG